MDHGVLLLIKFVFYSFIIAMFVVFLVYDSKRRKKQCVKLLGEINSKKYSCKIINAKSRRGAVFIKLSRGPLHDIRVDVVLKENSIVLLSGYNEIQPEIMIEDIENLELTEIVLTDALHVRQYLPADIENRYGDLLENFYLTGLKDDLFEIKEFIEGKRGSD